MMFRKCSCSLLLVPIVLLLQAIVLAFNLVQLTAGSGSLDNNDHQPQLSNYYIARIEADGYSTAVSGDAAPYKGLPDSHDFSKQKDWYAIYASLYCSGRKNAAGQYFADYCSPWPGKQLFDLHWLWRVWGVDLVADNYIGVFPRTIFASLLTSTAASGLTIVLGALSFCSHWCLVLATAASLVSLVAALTLAASSQTFVTRLTSAQIPISAPGTGKIAVTAGPHHVRNAWIASGVALVAALLWLFILVRAHQARLAAGASSLKGKRRRGGGGTGYRNLDSFGGDGEGEKWHGQQTGLVLRSVSPLRGMPLARFEDGEPGGGGGMAYEPMRHRDVGV